MKKIFILKGKNDTGKTIKINRIAEWIINNHGATNTINFDSNDLKNDINGVLEVSNLTIGINSSGDNLMEVRKIERLKSEIGEYPDILLCACRTKGKGRKYIDNNFNYSKGWLKIYIDVKEHNSASTEKQMIRDERIIAEMQAWLTGLKKIENY
ncbi:hypothetical protein [Geofilum rubicundum]|uniref:Uncharacterized protein n=1 Tax=Geofilum rubicundum JCM 15548 TaxID=1236989 RepID=A0A0E9M2A1_9BACT|nr:hypothetical protein [Geofilum rubicundum]GAO31728.1 hypothetical protein JCM15548_14122 [Geofilum rubicundum JCM 15548]